MQFLLSELTKLVEVAKEEEVQLEQGATYQIWSPCNSHEAAHQLAKLLEDDEKANTVSV